MNLTRRDFMKATGAAGAAMTLGPGMAFGRTGYPKKPNIIVMMVDDMGFSDLSCLGAEIQTPHLDSLAKNGVMFVNGHSTGRCWPSRACILTGLYPHQMGYENKTPITVEERKLRRSGGVFIPEILNGVGYSTCMAGKWHLDGNPGDRGFKHTGFCFRGQGGGSSGAGSFWHKSFGPTEYITDHIGDRVAGNVDQAAKEKQPFFIYWTPTAPHWPLHAFTSDIAKYKGKYDTGPKAIAEARIKRMRELGVFDAKHPWSVPEYVAEPNKGRLADVCTELEKDNPKPAKGFNWCHWKSGSYGNKRKAASYEEMMEIYAAQVDRMDQSVGKVIAKLKETGTYDNTLFLFCSDNGASSESMGNGRAWAGASNTPFKRWKKDSYEGGVATPFLVHWPAATPQARRGTVDQTWCHLVDVMPTVLDAAGATHPGKDKHGRDISTTEGRSILAALKGDAVPLKQPIFIDHSGNRAVITEEWKLVAQSGQPWSLYNMTTDRFEQKSLATAESDRVKKMDETWKEWGRRVGAFIPGESPEPKSKKKKRKKR